jgi:hypothetical protein
VFENRMLRRIFGPTRDEVTGGWRKLRNEKLHNLHFSPNIIGMMRSRRMRREGDLTRNGRRMNTGYWREIQNERDYYENQDVGE